MKQGIRNIIGAAFCFALMNLFVQLSGDVPVIQKCFFRNIVALLLSIGTLIKTKQKFVIGKGNTKYLFLRAFFGTLGLVCNFYAIDHLNSISDASILNKLSPFFAILFSILLLKERPNKKEIAAIVIAFCGALFVIRPSINMECLPALIGVFGGLCAGLAYTCVRKLGQLGEKGAIIIFFFSGFSTIAFLPYLLLHYSPMTPASFGYLLLAGLAATGGQFCITAAYKFAPAKQISVYDYTQVLFAALLGFVFLGQIPDSMSFIGYAIIIGSAFYKAKR